MTAIKILSIPIFEVEDKTRHELSVIFLPFRGRGETLAAANKVKNKNHVDSHCILVKIVGHASLLKDVAWHKKAHRKEHL